MQTSQKIQAKAIVIPDRYLCSITQQIMLELVFTDDGYTYKREAMLKKLNTF